MLFSVAVSIIYSVVFYVLQLPTYLGETSSLGAFITAFGTLYGVVIGFVVVEVWSQNNEVQSKIDKEAKELENLQHAISYLRDSELSKRMNIATKKYIDSVLADKFRKLGSGQINSESDKNFLEIGNLIKDVKFDDPHDQVLFPNIFKLYTDLRATRNSLSSISLTRLPDPINLFIHATSFLLILSFLVMPFGNVFYGMFTVYVLTFLVIFMHNIIEDLDNPFIGYWNVTSKPFEMVGKTIVGE